MAALAADPELKVDGYLCPAHVSAVIGAEAYVPLARDHKVPCVVTGFEPLDMLQGVAMLARQVVAGEARVENQYSRIVKSRGQSESPRDPLPGLRARRRPLAGHRRHPRQRPADKGGFAAFDAGRQISVAVEEPREHPGCRCGEILKGKVAPEGLSPLPHRLHPRRPRRRLHGLQRGDLRGGV